MLNHLSEINWLAVLAATVIFAFLGGVHFTAIVGKPYAVALSYLLAQTLTIAINPNFPRPLLYALINAPYFIVCAVIASIILTLWR